MRSTVSVIGGGISGLSASCFLAASGTRTLLFEKNDSLGGRARSFRAEGFSFDMGPSWYWMPDVIERFFERFDRRVSDYYQLVKLDPGFQIIFDQNDVLRVPANEEELYRLFETREKGSSSRLRQFLREAARKYGIAMGQLVRKPAFSWLEFASLEIVKAMPRMHIFQSVREYVRRYFTEPGLVTLLEFPVLFLGAMPDRIPALYSLMNHAALSQGTYYPMGGMIRLVEGLEHLTKELGTEVTCSAYVERLEAANSKVEALSVNGIRVETDALIASGDYHHIENSLLEPRYRNYDDRYWQNRVMAPSCLIFFLGVSKKIPRLEHHNLFFDAGFETHSRAIYDKPRWPENPLFYTCCPSKTDPAVAPPGMENLFVLIPLASGLPDDTSMREKLFKTVVKRMEAFCGEQFETDIVYKRSYCMSDFETDYHAFRGNAYGLANTLAQTAVLKPSMRNKKLGNLFYAGQLTVPGPGVPPSLISGEIAAMQVKQYLKKKIYESIV